MLATTYLTTDKLRDYTPISANVDISQLENWIPVVEELHILPVIGVSLDTALKLELETLGTLTGNNATLLTYILNAEAWYCLYEAIGWIRSKVVNKGLVQQFSDNSQVVSTEDYKILKQEALDKAMFYRNALIDYLEANTTLFPLYRSSFCNNSDYDECDDNCNGRAKSYPSGIYLG